MTPEYEKQLEEHAARLEHMKRETARDALDTAKAILDSGMAPGALKDAARNVIHYDLVPLEQMLMESGPVMECFAADNAAGSDAVPKARYERANELMRFQREIDNAVTGFSIAHLEGLISDEGFAKQMVALSELCAEAMERTQAAVALGNVVPIRRG